MTPLLSEWALPLLWLFDATAAAITKCCQCVKWHGVAPDIIPVGVDWQGQRAAILFFAYHSTCICMHPGREPWMQLAIYMVQHLIVDHFHSRTNFLGGAEFFTLQPHLEVLSSVRYTAAPCSLSGSFARTHMPCQWVSPHWISAPRSWGQI